MAGTAHLVPALIIGKEEDDIWLLSTLAGRAKAGRQEHGEQPRWGTRGQAGHENLQVKIDSRSWGNSKRGMRHALAADEREQAFDVVYRAGGSTESVVSAV